MQAVLVSRPGGPEVLEVAELAAPTPHEGQLLVRVSAAGVNFIDTYQRSGAYPTPTPFTLGLEGAGTVLQGAGEFSAGDRVAWKAALGSYAEQVCVPVAEAVAIPDALSDEIAAALMLQGLTAHYLATATYPVAAGDWVLVHAAAGGVGLLLTQLVVQRGAHVIATAGSAEKAELARAAGAEHVVLYREQDFAAVARELTDGRGVQVVYDGVGAATFEASLRSLAPRGLLALFGAASGPVPPFDLQRLNPAGSLYVTRPTLAHYTADRAELTDRAGQVLGAAAAGRLSVRIGARYPLAQARAAHEDLQGRRTTGKLLLIPAGG